MATLLQSSRYIRCLNSFTRRIVVANNKSKFDAKCLAIQAQCINSYLTKSYATAAPAMQRNELIVNYDKIISTLDHKVQRYGRVYYTEVESVLEKIRYTGFIPSRDALLLIRCCGELLIDYGPKVRNQLVQEIWNTLNTLKIPMDISHFNALLRVYLENDHEFSPIEFLSNLKTKGVEPNRVTYQRLILYYCKQGDIQGATKILEFMKEKGVPLNEYVFNALITGYSEANDMESAKNILNIMKDVGLEPDAKTYTTLYCAYAKRGDIESITNSLNEICVNGVTLHDKDFLDIVHVLAANDHNNMIDHLLSALPRGTGYNVDAVHAILKILDVRNVDAALKILGTMKRKRNTIDGEEMEVESGTFLIKKLVNANFTAAEVIKTCALLEEKGYNNRAFNIATQRALENGDGMLGSELLKAWKENGGILREHYFWPLIVAHGKSSNFQGIHNVMEFMVKDCNITPSFETITTYVLPYTVGQWEDSVKIMQGFRVPQTVIAPAIAYRLLLDKKIRKTAMFMAAYPVNYEAAQFYRPLAESLNTTGDAKSFVIILRYLYASAASLHGTESDNERGISDAEKVVETALLTMLNTLTKRKAYVDDVLTHMVEIGMSITPEIGEQLKLYFQEESTPEILEKIKKLTSGSLELTPLSEFDGYGASKDEARSLGNDDPRKLLAIKRRMLNFHLQAGNIDVVKELLKELKELQYNFTPANYARVIETACATNDLELAEKWYKKMREQYPEESLDIRKILKYAMLLITNNRFDDAIHMLSEHPRKGNPKEHMSSLTRFLKNCLDTVAETGDVEKTKQFFDTLVQHNYMAINNYMLGPIVKVHLNRDDYVAALEAFQNACLTFQCTPLKNELSKKFIDTEDADSLQSLTDLSTQIHGESNSLADLVLSFLECGRVRQARKILETPGLKLRSKKLQAFVDRYILEKNMECLQLLLELTKGLQVVDRREIYEIYLHAYDQKNDWRRALSLWTDMQDEDIQPDDAFLNTLAHLLKRNNQPIPFIYEEENFESQKIAKYPQSPFYTYFKDAMNEADLAKAEDILIKLNSGNKYYTDAASQLIDAYVKQKQVDKALAHLEMLLMKHQHQPRAATLKGVWNALIDAKKFDKLRTHAESLNTFTKRQLRFHKYLIRATLAEKGLTKCLEDFEAKLTSSRDENITIVINHLHFTSYLRAFDKDPSSLEKFRPVAEKLAEEEIYLPINMVWCYYFKRNDPEADNVWTKYLTKAQWIIFDYIFEKSKDDNNVEMLKRLYDRISDSKNLSENAKMKVLTNLVDLYCTNQRYEEADDLLKSVENYNSARFPTTHISILKKLRQNLDSRRTLVNSQSPDTRQDKESEFEQSKNPAQ